MKSQKKAQESKPHHASEVHTWHHGKVILFNTHTHMNINAMIFLYPRAFHYI